MHDLTFRVEVGHHALRFSTRTRTHLIIRGLLALPLFRALGRFFPRSSRLVLLLTVCTCWCSEEVRLRRRVLSEEVVVLHLRFVQVLVHFRQLPLLQLQLARRALDVRVQPRQLMLSQGGFGHLLADFLHLLLRLLGRALERRKPLVLV